MKNLLTFVIALMSFSGHANASKNGAFDPIKVEQSVERLISYKSICSYLSRAYASGYGQVIFSAIDCMDGEKVYFGPKNNVISHVQIQIPLYYNKSRSVTILFKLDLSKRGSAQASDFQVVSGAGGE